MNVKEINALSKFSRYLPPENATKPNNPLPQRVGALVLSVLLEVGLVLGPSTHLNESLLGQKLLQVLI